MKKVKERLSILKMNDIEKDAYYKYMKEVLTHQDTLNAAEARGKAKGELENAKNIAKKMLTENMEIDLILGLTNLTIDDINKLKS